MNKQHVFIALGWVAKSMPEQPSGPLGISVTDVDIGLLTPNGALMPTPIRIWHPDTDAGVLPLIICNPVWGSERGDNSVICSALASRGFVVVSLDDVHFDPADFDRTSEDAVLRDTLFEIASADDRVRMTTVVRQRVELQVAKLTRLLDALEAPPPEWPALARFDRNRIGIFGASFGGAVAVELAQTDARRRIRAVVNLDGWLQGASTGQPMPVPFADIISVRGMPSYDKVTSANPMKQYLAKIRVRCDGIVYRIMAERTDCIRIAIKGANHADLYNKLYDPERWKQWRPWRGPMIRPERLRLILDTYMAAFFETHLKDQTSPLLQEKSPFREAVVDFSRPPTPTGSAAQAGTLVFGRG